MNLSISITARDRFFGKAVRPLLRELENLKIDFAAVRLAHPIHEVLLIGITDERPPGTMELITDGDGYFQVLAGILWPADQEALKLSIKGIVRDAVHRCPFSEPDRRQFMELLARHAIT